MHQFAGEYFDDTIGFQYHRARWYDPNLGRFISQDRFAGAATRPSSLHKYVYAGDDPVNLVDPSGNNFLSQTMAGVSGLSLMLSVRVTMVVGGVAANSPRLAGALGFLASALMPLEMQLAAGQANFAQTLGTAGYGALYSSARQLTQTAERFKANGNFIGEGIPFEGVVAGILGITKNKTPISVVLSDSVGEVKAVPDFYWNAAILEVKTSGGAINIQQALRFTAWSISEQKPLTYLFYKKPSAAQLDSLERAIKAEFGDDAPMPIINYIFG